MARKVKCPTCGSAHTFRQADGYDFVTVCMECDEVVEYEYV